MAYYNDEDDLANQDPNAVGAQAQPMTSQASGVVGGGGAAPQAASQKPDQSGSNFVGLKTYLDANRAQGAKLGDKVAGQVSSKIGEAQNQVAQLPGQFQQEATAAALKNLSTAGTEAKNIVSTASTGKAPLAQDQTNRFKEISTAEYKGPKTLQESQTYAPAVQNIQRAQSYADLSKNESGSQSLLKDLYKSPGYNSGENRLDAYLLNSQDNRQKLAANRASADALNNSMNQATQGASQYAQGLVDQTNAARQGARTELETQRSERSKQIENLLAKVRSGWDSEYKQYEKLLNDAGKKKELKLNADQMKELDVKEKQRIFNLLTGNNAKDYLALQKFDPNKVISKSDQSSLAMLDDLANLYGGELTNKYTQADLAETLRQEDAFSGAKFGKSAIEAQKLFDLAAKTAALEGVGHSDENVKARAQRRPEVRDPFGNVIVPAQYVNYDVGSTSRDTTARGTVEDYLKKRDPKLEHQTSNSWANPLASFDQDSMTAAIRRVENQSSDEAREEWAKSILKYLKDAGYNNRVKRG